MIKYTGGSGNTREQAIKITGAEDGVEGIGAEYEFLRLLSNQLGQEVKMVRQSLHHHGDKSYDMMVLQFEDGNSEEIWFDITDFYGNYPVEE